MYESCSNQFRLIYLLALLFVEQGGGLKKFGGGDGTDILKICVVGLCGIQSTVDFFDIDNLNRPNEFLTFTVTFPSFLPPFICQTQIRVKSSAETRTAVEDFRLSKVDGSINDDGRRLFARFLKRISCC